jgi:hypothetical protein
MESLLPVMALNLVQQSTRLHHLPPHQRRLCVHLVSVLVDKRQPSLHHAVEMVVLLSSIHPVEPRTTTPLTMQASTKRGQFQLALHP